jgi:hypothetical protein
LPFHVRRSGLSHPDESSSRSWNSDSSHETSKHKFEDHAAAPHVLRDIGEDAKRPGDLNRGRRSLTNLVEGLFVRASAKYLFKNLFQNSIYFTQREYRFGIFKRELIRAEGFLR